MGRHQFQLIFAIFILFMASGCENLLNNMRPENQDDDDDFERPPKIQNSMPSLRSENNNSINNPTVLPKVKRSYGGGRVTKDDFIDQGEDSGSLWSSNGQTNYYFIKNKLRNIGDIITLTVDNDLHRDILDEIKESLSSKEKLNELTSVQDQLRAKYLSTLGSDGIPNVQPSPSPSADKTLGEVEDPNRPKTSPSLALPMPTSTKNLSPEIDKLIAKTTLADVNLEPNIDIRPGANMTGEILERYPNGNYKVMAVKRVPYKKGTPRLVSVIGIVKGSDITEDTDIIPSGKLYDYKVEIAK